MFVSRLASDLEYPDEIRQRARTLAEQAEERGVTTGVHRAGSQWPVSTRPVARRGDG